MKILITGGAGYIGTMLSNKLADDGHEITVVDLFWFGDFLNDNIKKVKMNLIDLTAEQVSEYEAVDIDTELDFKVSETIYKNVNGIVGGGCGGCNRKGGCCKARKQ